MRISFSVMPSRPQLTWPGLIALIAVLLVLAYFERQGGGDGGVDLPSPLPSASKPDRGSGGSGDDDRTASSRVGRDQPGDFDYYSLVLSWSPTHCASPEGQDDDSQCARRDGRRYAFILHGLWPQYERGYPEDCPTRERPYVPQSVIDRMLDIMPSKGLIIHEYRKHGTCSGLSPEGYYDTARRFFGRIKIPDRFRNPTEPQFLDPRDVVGAFAAANPGLKSDMVAVACRGPGSRLREVRICFTKGGALRSCGSNEDQGGLCRSSRMHVPPVR
jgi:ribonuclease T2